MRAASDGVNLYAGMGDCFRKIGDREGIRGLCSGLTTYYLFTVTRSIIVSTNKVGPPNS